MKKILIVSIIVLFSFWIFLKNRIENFKIKVSFLDVLLNPLKIVLRFSLENSFGFDLKLYDFKIVVFYIGDQISFLEKKVVLIKKGLNNFDEIFTVNVSVSQIADLIVKIKNKEKKVFNYILTFRLFNLIPIKIKQEIIF